MSPQYVTLYVIIATLVMIFNAVIWSKSGWINVFLKFFFVFASIYGVLVVLNAFGFVVRT